MAPDISNVNIKSKTVKQPLCLEQILQDTIHTK